MTWGGTERSNYPIGAMPAVPGMATPPLTTSPRVRHERVRYMSQSNSNGGLRQRSGKSIFLPELREKTGNSSRFVLPAGWVFSSSQVGAQHR